MAASKFETGVAATLLVAATVFIVQSHSGLRDAEEKARDQNRRMCTDIGPTLPPCDEDVGEIVDSIIRKHPYCDPHRKEMIFAYLNVQKRCEEHKEAKVGPTPLPGPSSPEENDNNALLLTPEEPLAMDGMGRIGKTWMYQRTTGRNSANIVADGTSRVFIDGRCVTGCEP